MTTPRWPRLLAALLFFGLLALNLYVFFTREWESSYYPSSYATLYYPTDVPTIREWRVADRNRIQLDISCTAEIRGWTVLTDGKDAQGAPGMQPTFRIDTTFSVPHTYRLTPVPVEACKEIEISIRFYPTEFYGSLGMKHDDVYIVRANVPCGTFQQYSIDDWVDDYAYVGKEGLAAVDKILREEVGITEGEPTYTRLEKVAQFLKAKLANSGGVPKDDERWMNPLQLYKEMAAGTGKGWCTQNAQLWVFWANRAGVPTRFVFVARTQDNTITYNGHSFAESFIREENRWACTDFMDGVLWVLDRNGEPLNAAELFQLNQHGAFDSTEARIYVNRRWADQLAMPRVDTIVTAPYALCKSAIKEELTPHTILKYRRPPNVEDVREIYTGFFKDWTFFAANINRYLFKPPLAYSFYPTEGADTYLLRRALFFALCADLLLWIILIVAARRRRRRVPSEKPEQEPAELH